MPERMVDAVTPEGIVVVDKPLDCTSHDVVSRLRKALGTRRVGHAGTLDPQASGVLVLGVGRATRLLGFLGASDKEYQATIVLGMSTTTDDAAGDIVDECDARGLSEQDVRDAAAGLTGDIEQVPSSMSAIKVDGRRAHQRVRAGEDVVLKARPVRVERFDILRISPLSSSDAFWVPNSASEDDKQGEGGLLEVDVAVTCSAGTYVRALARDLGRSLGVGGHVSALRRIRSGAFDLSDAGTLADVERVAPQPMSTAEAARRSLPWVDVGEEFRGPITHGVQIPWPDGARGEGPVALVSGEHLLGIAHRVHGRAAYDVVFAGPDST